MESRKCQPEVWMSVLESIVLLDLMVSAEGTHFQGAREGRIKGTVFGLSNLICSKEEIMPAAGKCLENIYKIPLEGALLVLWKASLCLDLHETSKSIKQEKPSAPTLSEGCHILTRAYPALRFPEYKWLPPADRLPFHSFHFGGPLQASLSLRRAQQHVACRDFAGCLRVADPVSRTGVGRHNVNWGQLWLPYHSQNVQISTVYPLLLEKRGKISEYAVGRVLSGVC